MTTKQQSVESSDRTRGPKADEKVAESGKEGMARMAVLLKRLLRPKSQRPASD